MEMYRPVLLSIMTMLFTCRVRGESFCPNSNANENLRNMVVMGSHVIVGSTNALYRLNPSLSEVQETRLLSQPNRMLLADPGGTYSDSVLECGTVDCSLSRITNLADIRWQVSSGVVRSANEEVVGIFAEGPNGTSSLHVGERAISDLEAQASSISKGDLVNVDLTDNQFNPYAYQYETIDVRPREFLTAFKFQNFVYFVVRLDGVSGSEVRLVRFCQGDRGGIEPGSEDRPLFASHYEAVLDCSSGSRNGNGNGGSMTAGHSATFIDSQEPFGTESVVVSFASLSGMDASATQYSACAYNLTMINELMQRKYNTCIAGGEGSDNLVGFARDEVQMPLTCPTFTQEVITISGVTECKLISRLFPGLEVMDPVSQSAFLSCELSGFFTSLVHTSLDGFSLLYAGSIGILFQFWIDSPSSAQFVRNISLAVPPTASTSETNVTRLLTSEDGEFIYALTPLKLFRHPVDMCGELSSCSECVDHPDPICGWCSLQGSCTRQLNCPLTAGRREWVTSSSFCPAIQSATPSTIYLPDLTDGLTIALAVANIPAGLSYRCVFNFGTLADAVVGAPQTLAMGTGEVVCVAPSRGEIPPIPSGQDTVNSDVSLHYEGVDFIMLQEPVSFTNCSVHRSCTACISSAQDCRWCLFAFGCISPGGACDDDQEVPAREGCPSIQPPIMGDYLLHINVPYDEPPLTILGTNLILFEEAFSNGEFMCEVCPREEDCSRVPAQLSVSQDQVHCEIEDNQFTYSGPEASLNATLSVVWTVIGRNIDNPTGAGVILYRCDRMGTNCGQCLALPVQFDCSYCNTEASPGSACALDQQCSSGLITAVSECDVPQILSFMPVAGPPEGGTEITIMGTNLGSSRDDVDSVRIGTDESDMVVCEVTAYDPGVSISCSTLSEDSSLIGPQPIVIQFSYLPNTPIVSDQNFIFIRPILERAFPLMGPSSGGTRLTIVGRFLNIGSRARVKVFNEDCPIQSITETTIVCVTPPVEEEERLNVFINVCVDNWDGELQNLYNYVRDPTFDSISPNSSFAAGGTTYTITGTGLNTVLVPRLFYYINSTPEAGMRRRRRQELSQETTQFVSEPCEPLSGAVMHCPAPAVPTSLPEGGTITATIGLEMDGVEDLRVLEVEVTVFPNPTFIQFTSVRSFSQNDDIFLQIEGSEFLFMVDQARVELTPCNTESCLCLLQSVNLTSSPQTITCQIENPNNLPAETPITVTVRLGNQTTVIGMIEIEPPLNLLVILIPIFVGVVIVLLAIIVLLSATYFCIHRHRSSVTLRDKDLGVLQLEPVAIPNPNPSHPMNEFMRQLPQKLVVASDQLQLLDCIGQGEFGVVYKAYLIKWQGHEGPQLVAAKTLKALFGPSDESMMDEILKMQDFQHPHVMSLLGVCLDSSLRLSVIMPYMANGSLSDYLKKERIHLVLSDRENTNMVCSVQKLLLRMCYQIAQGMEYLAEKKIVHRDLAARNCMLNDLGDIKVADFGLSEDMYATGYFRQANVDATVKLPYKWMSPESLEDGLFSEKSDVWAFGVTCWEIFTGGKTPYPAMDPMSLMKLLENGQRLEKPSNAACSRKIYSVMQRCWLDEPSMRPAFSDLVVSLCPLLESVAGYTQLSMALTQPAAAESPVEKNPVYGLMDKIAMETDLEYEEMQ